MWDKEVSIFKRKENICEMHLLITGILLVSLAVDGVPLGKKKMHKRGTDEHFLEKMFEKLEKMFEELEYVLWTFY